MTLPPTWPADSVLAALVLEAIVLFAFGPRLGRGIGPLDTAMLLLPGLFLLIAVRLGLAAAGAGPVALALALAGAAHAAALWRALRR